MAILVVEDEALIRMFMADVLSDAGFRVVEAVNADEALLMLAARSDVSVLVTDVRMPGTIDGLVLARTVADRWPDIGILVCSGHAQPTDGGLPVGAVFLHKPYRAEVLVTAVERLNADSAISPEAATEIDEDAASSTR